MNRQLVRRVGWLGLAVCGIGLTGCGGGEKNTVEMRPVSRSGESQYAEAQRLYIQSRSKYEQGERQRQSMDQVARNLKGAIHNDQDCPLFYSRLGDVQLELGAPSEAFTNLEESVRLYKDWIPGWLGLATWATEQMGSEGGKRAYAEARLADAKNALNALFDKVEKAGAGTQESLMPGGNLMARSEQKKKREDPTRSETEQLNMILSWLIANEQWLVENPAIAFMADGMMMTGSINDKLNRRLRARIEYQYAEIAIAAKDPADRVIDLLDEALRWDENLVTARLEKAAQLRKMGRYQMAESLLEPYLKDTSNPVYKNNGRLWFEAAANYTDWYVASSGGADVFDKAQIAFNRLFDINENQAEAWLRYAHLLYHGGTRVKDPQHLQNAQKCVKNFRELAGNNPEATQLAQNIDAALQQVK